MCKKKRKKWWIWDTHTSELLDSQREGLAITVCGDAGICRSSHSQILLQWSFVSPAAKAALIYFVLLSAFSILTCLHLQTSISPKFTTRLLWVAHIPSLIYIVESRDESWRLGSVGQLCKAMLTPEHPMGSAAGALLRQ